MIQEREVQIAPQAELKKQIRKLSYAIDSVRDNSLMPKICCSYHGIKASAYATASGLFAAGLPFDNLKARIGAGAIFGLLSLRQFYKTTVDLQKLIPLKRMEDCYRREIKHLKEFLEISDSGKQDSDPVVIFELRRKE